MPVKEQGGPVEEPQEGSAEEPQEGPAEEPMEGPAAEHAKVDKEHGAEEQTTRRIYWKVQREKDRKIWRRTLGGSWKGAGRGGS